MPNQYTVPPLPERFWSKVNKDGPVPKHRPELGPCWIWLAYTSRKEYGRIRVEGKIRYAHTIAYELVVGPIPPGLEPDHLCRTPSCVRPSHIEPVTKKVNCLRGASFAAVNARKTECPRGHPYTPENTAMKALGRRECRTCKNKRQLARYHRLAAARAYGGQVDAKTT